MLLEEGFQVTSVDASDKMLKYALKERWERRKEEPFDRWGAGPGGCVGLRRGGRREGEEEGSGGSLRRDPAFILPACHSHRGGQLADAGAGPGEAWGRL